MSKVREAAKFANRALTDGKLSYDKTKLSLAKSSDITSSNSTSFFDIYKGKATRIGNNYKLKTSLGVSIKNDSVSVIILGEIYKNLVINADIGLAGSNKSHLSIQMNNGYATKRDFININGFENYLTTITKNGIQYLGIALRNVIGGAPVIVDGIFSDDSIKTLEYITDLTTIKLSSWDFDVTGSKKVFRPFQLPEFDWLDFETSKLSDGRILCTGGAYDLEASNEGSGSLSQIFTAKNYIFDPISLEFERISDLPMPLSNHRQVSLKFGSALITGGRARVDTGTTTPSIVYNPKYLLYTAGTTATNIWTSGSNWLPDGNAFASHAMVYDNDNDYVYVFIDQKISVDGNTVVGTCQMTRRKVTYGAGSNTVSIDSATELLATVPTGLFPSGSSGTLTSSRGEMVYYKGKIYLPFIISLANYAGYGAWDYGLVYDIATNTWSKWVKHGLILQDMGPIAIYNGKIYASGLLPMYKTGTTSSSVPIQYASDINISDIITIDLVTGSIEYKSPINVTNNASYIDKTSTSVGTSCGIEPLDDGRIAFFGGFAYQASLSELFNPAGSEKGQKRTMGWFYYPENDEGTKFSGISKMVDGTRTELSAVPNYISLNQATTYKGNLYYITSSEISSPLTVSSLPAKLIKYNISADSITVLPISVLDSSIRGSAFTVNKTTGDLFIVGGIIKSNGVETPTVKCYKANVSDNTWSAIANLPVSLSYHKIKIDSSGNILVFGGILSDGKTFNKTIYKYNATNNAWTWSANVLPYALNNGDITEVNGRIFVFYGNDESGNPNLTFSIIETDGSSSNYSLVNKIDSNTTITGATKLNTQIIRLMDNYGKSYDYNIVNNTISPVNTKRYAILSKNGIVKLQGDKIGIVGTNGEVNIVHLYQRDFGNRFSAIDRTKIISAFNTAISGQYADATSWENIGGASFPQAIPLNEYDNDSVLVSYNIPSRASTSGGWSSVARNIVGLFNQNTETFNFYNNTIMSCMFGAFVTDCNGNPLIIGGKKDRYTKSTLENGISYIDYSDLNNFNMNVFKFDMATKTLSSIATLPRPFASGAMYFDKDERKVYLFSGDGPYKMPYSNYMTNNPCSTVKSMVYDINANTFTELATLPSYGLKHSGCFRLDKDTIIILGGSIGLINDSVGVSNLPRNLGAPNTKVFAYSISNNTFTDVTSQYSFIQEFQGIKGGLNEFHEIYSVKRLPNTEKREVLITNRVYYECTANTGAFVHDAYSPNFYGVAMHILDLDTKKFRLVNTFDMVMAANKSYVGASYNLNKSILHSNVEGKLIDMGYYTATASQNGNQTKTGVIYNYI
jgi:hypothetical protein